jgi:hypothetical protein
MSGNDFVLYQGINSFVYGGRSGIDEIADLANRKIAKPTVVNKSSHDVINCDSSNSYHSAVKVN